MLNFEVIEEKDSDFVKIIASCSWNSYIDRSVFRRPKTRELTKRLINNQKKELTLCYETAMMLKDCAKED